ncbi:MAG: polyprenyl synthetase family protein [Cetobacterium sp.]|uniref:polyprenyl synthetase family protein n=1 Tax=Cetobacterium sp. TaxID=2071632 RepID=UPI003F34E8EB
MFKDYLKEKKDMIETALMEELNKLTYPEVIAEGMKYAVLNGGKRLRPILLLMTLELLQKDIRKGLHIGGAIEMIHSYSLVHDDLPALDNDDYRRGKLTTHKKFGEAEGILIGDALLTHAFAILSEKREGISAEDLLEIVNLTSRYAGVNGMIGGQMIDIESEGKKIDFETLKYIHANKTGKLIRLPIEIGCVLGRCSKDEREILVKYSELIGLGFQIKDDILDVEGDFEKLGKPVGSDIELEKSTYPSIFGMTKAKELLEKTIIEAKDILIENFGYERSKRFLDLADYIGYRES